MTFVIFLVCGCFFGTVCIPVDALAAALSGRCRRHRPVRFTHRAEERRAESLMKVPLQGFAGTPEDEAGRLPSRMKRSHARFGSVRDRASPTSSQRHEQGANSGDQHEAMNGVDGFLEMKLIGYRA